MASPRKRISVSGPQGGLNAAFAGLQMDGLPQGPESGADDAEAGPEALGPVPKPGRVVLRREKAHRGGKTVLVVDGFGEQHTEKAIEALGRKLRAACGCGGTVDGRSLEIQGDQAARVRTFLEAEGFQVAGER